MAQESAGILVYRVGGDAVDFFLVHPGGPFWSKKDDGAWSVPKGLLEDTEDQLDAAKREFLEETGKTIDGVFQGLTPLKQKSGKIVHCWAIEGNLDPVSCKSNLFEMEWPRGSGKMQSFEEVDRYSFFSAATALRKILPGQAGFIRELLTVLKKPIPTDAEINVEKGDGENIAAAQGSLF